ncbi:MAG: ABC transporter ATP-binding protein, partial [Planctomycetota bacterium]
MSKKFGEQQVLHSLDLGIEHGKLVGFLGPNGAGKSTTIRILMGLLKKTSGRAYVLEHDVQTDGHQIRSDVGYLPGDVNLYSQLTGIQTLQFMAAARKKDCVAEAVRLSEVFDLDIGKRVRQYSTGMKQKLGLIQALMHRPKLLILDEPTSALDPLVRTEVFRELRESIGRDQTVLFSSHSLDEVESLCDEVVVLREGRIVEKQTIDQLRNRALKRICVVFKKPIQEMAYPEGFQNPKLNGRNLNGIWSGNLQVLLSWLAEYEVEDLVLERPDLNDLFLSFYTE